MPMRTATAASHRSRPTGIASLSNGVAYSLTVFVLLRLLLSAAAVGFVEDHPPDPSATGPGAPPAVYTFSAEPGWHNAIDGMQRYDAAWFLWIAAEGYETTDARAALFPGYPLLIRITSWTGLDDSLAATLVSNAAFALSLVVLYALTRFELHDDRASRRTVVLFACLPTSFFFLAPYSEAPFLLASLLAFYWARTERWGLRVALSCLAACLLRSIGVVLVVALIVEAVRQRRLRREAFVRHAASAAVGLCAPIAYAAWWWLAWSAPAQPLRVQAYWKRELSVPAVTIWSGLHDAVRAAMSHEPPYLFVDAALVMLALIAAIGVWRRSRTYGIYVWSSLLVPLVYSSAPSRPFLSLPRFAAVLFPIAWVGEGIARRRQTFVALTGLSLVCQIVLAVQFMNWGWIF